MVNGRLVNESETCWIILISISDGLCSMKYQNVIIKSQVKQKEIDKDKV